MNLSVRYNLLVVMVTNIVYTLLSVFWANKCNKTIIEGNIKRKTYHFPYPPLDGTQKYLSDSFKGYFIKYKLQAECNKMANSSTY